jgi:hypothetical protein
MKINGAVHSKDNAYRLNMFLESHKNFAKNAFNITVFYECSEDSFQNGYNKVMGQFRDHKYIKVSTLKKDVIEEMENSESDLYAIFTDEDMFYRKVNDAGLEIITSTFKNTQDMFAFSLRLGYNIKENKRFQSPNIIIALNEKSDSHLMVDWSKHYLDFGFPLCVHGHVFRRKEIKKLSNKVRFENFDELQENLQLFDNFPKKKLGSFKNSVIVTDAPAPSETADILIKKILNLRLINNKYMKVKIKKESVNGIESNFGIYALLLQAKKNEKQH